MNLEAEDEKEEREREREREKIKDRVKKIYNIIYVYRILEKTTRGENNARGEVV